MIYTAVPSFIDIGLLVVEKKIFTNFSVFLLFCYYLPFEKGVALHMKNFEFPPPKDDLR
jgi:hypothetical protein